MQEFLEKNPESKFEITNIPMSDIIGLCEIHGWACICLAKLRAILPKIHTAFQKRKQKNSDTRSETNSKY